MSAQDSTGRSAGRAKAPTGIRTRHGRSCRSAEGARCNCNPGYEAWAYDKREGKKIRRSFPTMAAAKAWRADATSDVRRGKLRALQTPPLREAAEAWLTGARDGSIRTRAGDAYKPSAIAGYEAALRDHILPELGALRLSEIARSDVQAIADRMLGDGADPSTIRNAIMPLRVIFRRALSRSEVALNPCSDLDLPAVRGRRDRIATPEEATALLAALPDADRPAWATALYAGLRAGELQALEWTAIDLAGGTIAVVRSYDPKARAIIEPKSRAGRRKVPIPAALRSVLLEARPAADAEGLAFARPDGHPFDSATLRRRAHRAWKAAGLEPIGLHECRHTFASLMIGAGVNTKALSTYMGHAGIAITFDRYGHLMPGNEDEAAGLLDAYLERANTAARLAQLDR